MILLLRGAPGAGKSTVAALLRTLRAGVAVVEVDDLRGDLWHVPPAVALPDDDRHEIAIAHAARTSFALLGAGVGLVVVVDTFASGGVASFVRALRGRAEVRTMTLIVERDEHARRLATRPHVPGVFRDLAVAAVMNAELHAGHARIDTTGASPSDVAARVLAAMAPSM